MALTIGRNTVEIRDGRTLVLPMKGNTKIYEGSLVALEAGLAIPGKKATGLVIAGRASEFVDNTGGSDAAKSVTVRRGVFKWNNDITNPVTDAEVMKSCYVLDDETVTALATGASAAGKVIGLENGEVIVETL